MHDDTWQRAVETQLASRATRTHTHEQKNISISVSSHETELILSASYKLIYYFDVFIILISQFKKLPRDYFKAWAKYCRDFKWWTSWSAPHPAQHEIHL